MISYSIFSYSSRSEQYSSVNVSDKKERSGVSMPLLPLASIVRTAEKYWVPGTVRKIQVLHPDDQNAIVILQSHGNQIVEPWKMRFSGVTGELLSLPVQTRTAAWWTRDTLFALHVGEFAGTSLRWLYFFSGLLGCGMIATGLILWTVKRRVKQNRRIKNDQSVEFGFRLVEALNVSTIAGLCTAVAVYFWANRLLPVDFSARAKWEFHCMYIAWGALLLHAGIRLQLTTSLRVWQEQLWLAAAAFALIPILNLATTDRHLLVTLPASDWVLAGFDLTVLAIRLLFGMAALKVRSKELSES